MVLFHIGKRRIYWKSHPFPEKLDTLKKNAKIIFCDSTCKKNTIEESCAEKIEETNIEFMSPGTPHQNGVIERGFATLYSQMRVMVLHAGLH